MDTTPDPLDFLTVPEVPVKNRNWAPRVTYPTVPAGDHLSAFMADQAQAADRVEPMADPALIPDALVVRLARDRDPNGDDLAELLHNLTSLSFTAATRVVERAHAAGLLEYNELTGELLNDARPTAAGLAILD